MRPVYRRISRLLIIAVIIVATVSVAFYVGVYADNSTLETIVIIAFSIVVVAKLAHLFALTLNSYKRSRDQ